MCIQVTSECIRFLIYLVTISHRLEHIFRFFRRQGQPPSDY
jgi:hypothetical protein